MNNNLNEQNGGLNQNPENQNIDFNPIPEPVQQPVQQPVVSPVAEPATPQVEIQPTTNPVAEQNTPQVEMQSTNPTVEQPAQPMPQEEIKMESVNKPLNIPLIILLGVIVIVVGIFLGKLLYDNTAGKDATSANDTEVVEPTPNNEEQDQGNQDDPTPVDPTPNPTIEFLNYVGLKSHTDLMLLMTQIITYNTTASNIITFEYNDKQYSTIQDIALLNTELLSLDVTKSFEISMIQDSTEIVTSITIMEYVE